MSRATIILFVLTICVAIVLCLSTCGPHEISVDCRNTCAVTCDTYPYRPRFCARICIKGCNCVEGYIRNSNGTCVMPCDC